jgi:glycosyltransferase involved in cell wall biosynthesis
MGLSKLSSETDITHVTFSLKGGAGLVSKELHEGQLRMGLSSKLLTKTNGGVESLILSDPRLFITALIDFCGVRNQIGNSLFTLFRKTRKFFCIESSNHLISIAHLHWMPGVFPGNIFENVGNSAGIVLTLHDMWPFTGGCHHSHECVAYEKDCSNCPQSRRFFRKRIVQSLKRKTSEIEELKNVIVIAPSEWIASRARASTVFRNVQIEVIPNPVNLEIFKPSDREVARSHFGVDQNAFVVGCSAVNLLDPQKNIKGIVEIISNLRQCSTYRNLVVFAVGGGKVSDDGGLVIHGGLIEAGETMAMAYQAMDVFVSLSHAENSPLSLIEAAAVGIPSICLDRGGMAEIVKHGINGYVISNQLELSGAIEEIIRRPKVLSDMSTKAVALARETFAVDVILKSYNDIYTELLSRAS